MAITVGAWDPLGANPLATNYGVVQWVNQTPFLSFINGSNTITSFFIGVVPWGAPLSAAGVKVDLPWSSHTSTTGNVTWGAAYERLGVAAVTADNYGTEVTVTTTVGGSIDIDVTTTVAIPYANMNSSVAGDPFRLRIRRITGDTMASAAQLFTVHLYTP